MAPNCPSVHGTCELVYHVLNVHCTAEPWTLLLTLLLTSLLASLLTSLLCQILTSTHTKSEPIETDMMMIRYECRKWCILWEPEESLCLDSVFIPHLPLVVLHSLKFRTFLIYLIVIRTAGHTLLSRCKVTKC